MHFDNDEDFDVNGSHVKVDLNWLSLHELGHSLGLDHSWNPDSVMFPFYLGYIPGLTLNKDDVDGIQQLYGETSFEKHSSSYVAIIFNAIIYHSRNHVDLVEIIASR